ncbi:hypothetical protein GTA08_BOTSDO13905 [Neofusicoccum parvum]|nr:hypothetical protein GTA08_BOTSDO13905 [Neofusicoccum parvum]
MESSLRDGYGPVSGDDRTTLQGERRGSTETEQSGMFGATALKEGSGYVNPMAAPSGRTSMSTTRTSRAIEHFDGNPNIPPYESIAEDPEYKRGRKRRAPPKWTHLIDRWNEWWVGEIIAALLSLGCLAVVIYILVDIGSDGKRLSDWTLSISPNSMVSTFITASRFLMLFVVAECIGQLRWIYYQAGPRPLDELEVFDSASRGAFGSVLFVLRMKARALMATLGALIVIVALAMDPFAQQILSFPSRPVSLNDGLNSAWLPAAQSWNNSEEVLYSTTMRKAIYGGLLDFETPVDFGCLTGNCTWDAFASLGVCSSCEDLSDAVTPTCSSSSNEGSEGNSTCSELTYTFAGYNLTLVLQNGSFVAPQEVGTPAAAGANDTDSKLYTLVKSVVGPAHPGGLKDPRMFEFAVAQLLVDSTTGLTWDSEDLQSPQWNITACAVSWCAKVYEDVEVKNGALSNTTPTNLNLTAVSNSTCWTDTTCQEFAPTNTSALPANANTTFYVGIDNSSLSIRNLMKFDYNVSVGANATDDALVTGAYNLATTMMWNTNISASFAHIATSMTNFVRASGPAAQRVAGTASLLQTFVVVEWAWFALPAAVVAAGALLLVAVVVLTALTRRESVGKGGVVWKSSSLPLLLLSPPKGEWRDDEWKRGKGRARVAERAGAMTGQLRADERGVVRFVKG